MSDIEALVKLGIERALEIGELRGENKALREQLAKSPDPLAQIAELLKPVGEFFDHLNKGEVSFVPGLFENVWGVADIRGFRVVISPKVGDDE